MSLWSPRERVLRRPDARGLVMPKLSAEPLTSDVEYDDLVIHRAWREYEADRYDEVRYFMYQLSQRDVGANVYQSFYKAVRFLRVTRVPRYLRQMNASTNGHGQQKKMLAGIREQQVLFVNVIAKSPHIPLIFAYGVQAVGETPQAAQLEADRSYEVLRALLDGVYQQLEYKPITVEEGELLARYQQQWRSIAMARGRPRKVGADGGVDSYLDGNKTDVENTQNMIDSFIRGMGDRSFLMSLITVPVAPWELSLVWRNLAKRLSDVRSEQSGSRGVNAGFALPLAMGAGLTDTQGASTQAGQTQGTGSADALGNTNSYGLTEGTSQSFTQGQSYTEGTSQSVSASETLGQNVGFTEGVSAGQSLGASQGMSEGQSLTASQGVNQGQSLTASQGVSEGISVNQSVTEGVSQGVSQGVSESVAVGVNQSQALGQSVTQGANWASSISNQVSGTVSATDSVANAVSQSLNQSINLNNSMANSISSVLNGTQGVTTGSGGGLNLPGFGNLGLNMGQNSTTGASWGQGAGATNGFGLGLTSGASLGTTVNQALGQSLSQGVSLGETLGGSNSVGLSATNTVGVSQSTTQGVSQTVNQAVSQALTQGVGQTMGVNQAVAQGVTQGASQAVAQGATQGVNQGVTQGINQGATQGASQGVSQASTTGMALGASQAASVSSGQTVGQSSAATVGTSDSFTQAVMANQAYSNAYVAALSRAAQQTNTIGVVPNVGLMLNRNTFDEGKRVIGDLIEAQMLRYLEGIDSGAFFYQLFLMCEDDATLRGASGLLKSSFWGSADGGRLPQPFHVTDRFDDEEKERLLQHAAAFTSYRRREKSMDLIEPYVWSTYLTPSEGAIMTQPPTAEALGLLAVHDSMPVFSMPYDRAGRDIYLGHIINGERARVSEQKYGLDLDELVHTLVAGATGSGKTTMLRRLLFEAVHSSKDILEVSVARGETSTNTVHAGALVLDWARSFRGLAAVLPRNRFKFFSVAKPELGEFRFNPLALPDDGMNPVEWAATMSDLFMVAFGLGEVARSIFYEYTAELYAANRLEPYTLRPAIYDDDGVLVRPAIELPPVDKATLPPGAIVTDATGMESANVYSCPGLSRLVCLGDLAVLVAAAIEFQATREGKALGGTNMQDRLQTVWRRLIAFAPGGALNSMFRADERLDEPHALRVRDLIDPDRGLVTVIEADGLDLTNRKFVLGALVQAVFRYGTHHGEGVFDQGGRGPGTFIIMEEAHELFGTPGGGEDRDAAATRVATYEALFRRARQYGLKLVAAVQNPSDIPNAILGNVGCIVSHQLVTEEDKEVMGSLMNWIAGIGQNYRELRYLGEQAVGHCIIRLKAQDHFLQAAPVHLAIDPPDMPIVTDESLAVLAKKLR